MTTPVIVLLAFAMWTLGVLMVGVGIKRWALILSGRAQLTDFPADQPHGAPAYRRAVRAHANCFENLPIYAAIVFAAYAGHIDTPRFDVLADVFFAGRVGQTLTHMVFVETNRTVLVRFLFFLTQVVCMIWMALDVVFASSFKGL